MKYIGNIQSQANAEVFAVASGALPDGKPVIINSDGTVSVAAETSVSQAVGSVVGFTSSALGYTGSTFDSSNNKVVIAYQDASNSNYGTSIVGTVSGTSISFGTAVVFASQNSTEISTAFDSNSNKVVVAYNKGNPNRGKARVGTVSGTGISFGTEAEFEAAQIGSSSTTFDSSNNKVVVGYFDKGNSNHGTAVVGTVSGTDISFGTPVVFEAASVVDTGGYSVSVTFDSNSNKVVIAYRDGGNSGHGTAIVGTVSSTAISFGTAVVFEAAGIYNPNITFDSNANKVVIAYRDTGNGDSLGTAIVGTVSNTSISFGTAVTINNVNTPDVTTTFDSTLNKVVIAYRNGSAGDGDSVVFQNASLDTNLTSENFLGFSTGFASPAVAGSATTFETGKTQYTDIAYIGSNKVVIAYQQHYNTSGSQTKDGYCIVGTISGTSISFGSATAFSTASAEYVHVANVENDKVVVFFRDGQNSNYATSRVGTVSGTGISFGTAVVAHSGNSAYTNVEGIGNDKVVGVYRDDGDSDKGKAIVGTVSGTDISFGSDVEFNTSGDGYDLVSIGSGKVVIAYKDVGNSGHGTAIVGTVSGTSISFGSEAVYEAATTGFLDTGIAYVGSDKVVISYQDEGNSDNGTAIVGTVSGTSISFGTAAVFEANATQVTNSTSIGGDKVVIVYSQGNDTGAGNGKYAVGTVSGTGISFDTAVTFNGAASWDMAVVSPEDNKVAISWGQHSNTSGDRLGQALVTTIEDRGSLADGKVATIQVGGAISTIQGGLTAGQQYFVQTDGTIGTTAATPSVIAGTAVSATDLIVKG